MKTDSPAEIRRVSAPAVKTTLPSVIAKSSSSARCLCGGGPPPAPSRQSSANIEPPDSSPVTRNVYMSPGPQNDLPVCPEAIWMTRLSRSDTLPPCSGQLSGHRDTKPQRTSRPTLSTSEHHGEITFRVAT